jgi:hypothetical protein
MIVVSDNCPSVLLLVGSELLKQGLTEADVIEQEGQ